VREALVYLSERDCQMTTKIRKKTGRPAPPRTHPSGRTRRVILGTVPDFAYRGPGVRISSVVPDSPAALAGLKANDILIALDGKKIESLRGYSNLLKSCSPGDTVEIRIKRGDGERTMKAVLKAR